MCFLPEVSKDSSSIKVIDFGLAELFEPDQKALFFFSEVSSTPKSSMGWFSRRPSCVFLPAFCVPCSIPMPLAVWGPRCRFE